MLRKSATEVDVIGSVCQSIECRCVDSRKSYARLMLSGRQVAVAAFPVATIVATDPGGLARYGPLWFGVVSTLALTVADESTGHRRIHVGWGWKQTAISINSSELERNGASVALGDMWLARHGDTTVVATNVVVGLDPKMLARAGIAIDARFRIAGDAIEILRPTALRGGLGLRWHERAGAHPGSGVARNLRSRRHDDDPARAGPQRSGHDVPGPHS